MPDNTDTTHNSSNVNKKICRQDLDDFQNTLSDEPWHYLENETPEQLDEIKIALLSPPKIETSPAVSQHRKKLVNIYSEILTLITDKRGKSPTRNLKSDVEVQEGISADKASSVSIKEGGVPIDTPDEGIDNQIQSQIDNLSALSKHSGEDLSSELSTPRADFTQEDTNGVVDDQDVSHMASSDFTSHTTSNCHSRELDGSDYLASLYSGITAAISGSSNSIEDGKEKGTDLQEDVNTTAKSSLEYLSSTERVCPETVHMSQNGMNEQECALHTELLHLLEMVPILCELPSDRLVQLVTHFRLKSYFPNSAIILAGEMPKEFFVLASGKASAYIYEAHDRPNTLVRTYQNADYFGEMSIINNTPCSAYVFADCNVTVQAMPVSDFKDLLSDLYPKFIDRANQQYSVAPDGDELGEGDIKAVEVLDNIPQFLTGLPLISGLPNLNKIVKRLYYHHFDDKEVLVNLNRNHDTFFIIYAGRLSLQIQDDNTKEQVEVLSLGSGMFIGGVEFDERVTALLSRTSYVACDRTVLLSLKPKHFKKHLKTLAPDIKEFLEQFYYSSIKLLSDTNEVERSITQETDGCASNQILADLSSLEDTPLQEGNTDVLGECEHLVSSLASLSEDGYMSDDDMCYYERSVLESEPEIDEVYDDDVLNASKTLLLFTLKNKYNHLASAFLAMDTDSDGEVSCASFIEFIMGLGIGAIDEGELPHLFDLLKDKESDKLTMASFFKNSDEKITTVSAFNDHLVRLFGSSFTVFDKKFGPLKRSSKCGRADFVELALAVGVEENCAIMIFNELDVCGNECISIFTMLKLLVGDWTKERALEYEASVSSGLTQAANCLQDDPEELISEFYKVSNKIVDSGIDGSLIGPEMEEFNVPTDLSHFDVISLALLNTQPFSLLSLSQRRYMVSMFLIRKYNSGECVITQGDVGFSLCLLLEGSLSSHYTTYLYTDSLWCQVSVGEFSDLDAFMSSDPATLTLEVPNGCTATVAVLFRYTFTECILPMIELRGKRITAIAEFLRTMPLFEVYSDSELDHISRACTIRQFKLHETIIKHGNRPQWFYILFDGSIAISMDDSDGTHKIGKTLQSSSLFCANDLVNDANHKITATASSTVRLLSWERTEFFRVFNKIEILVENDSCCNVTDGLLSMQSIDSTTSDDKRVVKRVSFADSN